MYYTNPLQQFHDMLRATAPAGYPNVSMQNPHPYEMSAYSGMRPVNRYPFRYSYGHGLRLQIKAPSGMQGSRYSLPRRTSGYSSASQVTR